MRRVFMLAVTILLSTLLMGLGPIVPMPRACPGSTIHGDYPCCVSGKVTLNGVAVEGAKVTVFSERGKDSDVTALVTRKDLVPTYGFLLNGEQLQAQPDEVVTLTATYEGWSRTVELVVGYGEQSLDIELGGINAR